MSDIADLVIVTRLVEHDGLVEKQLFEAPVLSLDRLRLLVALDGATRSRRFEVL